MEQKVLLRFWTGRRKNWDPLPNQQCHPLLEQIKWKKVAGDLKCLTPLAFEVPSMQIQAWSLLSTAKGPEALFNTYTTNLALAGMLSAVKSEAIFTSCHIEEQAWTLAPWHSCSLWSAQKRVCSEHCPGSCASLWEIFTRSVIKMCFK